MSEGWVVEGGVVSVHPDFPDGVAGACVGLLRIFNRFYHDVKGLDAGTINNVGLSTLACKGARALSQSPGGAVAGQRFMLILVFIPLFGQWRRRWWCCRWLL